jgi:lipopolysaccharide/colanic/teichoic acid biosynthesis glycosyltransferase
VKRLFDFFVVAVAAPLWLPLLAVVALWVRIKLGSPVFFRHKRPGKNAQIFEMIKFRTMTDARDAGGQLLPDAVRLTRFGKFMRSASLDELPELLNVLRGDMSLVGPRPLMVQYLPRYTAQQARRHEVTPGITGLAQVKGRNALSWEEKFAWDVRYVETWSLWLDLKILLLTVKTVFVREGISAQGDATMPEFNPSSTPKPGAADFPR